MNSAQLACLCSTLVAMLHDKVALVTPFHPVAKLMPFLASKIQDKMTYTWLIVVNSNVIELFEIMYPLILPGESSYIQTKNLDSEIGRWLTSLKRPLIGLFLASSIERHAQIGLKYGYGMLNQEIRMVVQDLVTLLPYPLWRKRSIVFGQVFL